MGLILISEGPSAVVVVLMKISRGDIGLAAMTRGCPEERGEGVYAGRMPVIDVGDALT